MIKLGPFFYQIDNIFASKKSGGGRYPPPPETALGNIPVYFSQGKAEFAVFSVGNVRFHLTVLITHKQGTRQNKSCSEKKLQL